MRASRLRCACSRSDFAPLGHRGRRDVRTWRDRDRGQRLREVLLDRDSVGITPDVRGVALRRGSRAARREVVRPALMRGAIVITDRYVDSSLAYQGAGRALPDADVRRLSSWATGGLLPGPHRRCSTSRRRSGSQRRGGPGDRLEDESLAFHRAGARDVPAARRAPAATATWSSTPPRPRSGSTRCRSERALQPLLPLRCPTYDRFRRCCRMSVVRRAGRPGPRRRAAARRGRCGAHVVSGGEATGMTHAWLFTGPPGSGRSVAARAFAAALQCPDGGCGVCHECHTAMAGSHVDIEIVTPTGLSYSVAETRALVARAALAPIRGTLAGHDRRGRRPVHRAGAQRAAQGARGAATARCLAAVRAVGRRPAPDHPLPLPSGDAASPAVRRGRRAPRERRYRRRPRPASRLARPRGTSAERAGWRPTTTRQRGAARC